MKKVLTFALAAIMALGVVTPVMAYNGYNEYNGYNSELQSDYPETNGYYDSYYPVEENYDLGTQFVPPAVGKVGYITNYDGEQLTIRGQFDEEEVTVNLHEGTVIITAEDGTPASIEDRTTDRVKVYHTTQSSALIVALNVPEYGMGPNFHIIEDLYWTDEDTLRITVDDGGLFIFLNREVPLNPHLTRQMVELEHLQKGDEMLFWYAMVALSFPGQAHPTRALFIRPGEVYENDKYALEYPENGYENGYEEVPAIQPPRILTVPGQGIMRDGIEFFPVRRTAYEAGYNVQWYGATRSAYVFVEDGVAFRLTVDSAQLLMNGGTYNLPAAVVLIDGTMYAPGEFFYML